MATRKRVEELRAGKTSEEQEQEREATRERVKGLRHKKKVRKSQSMSRVSEPLGPSKPGGCYWKEYAYRKKPEIKEREKERRRSKSEGQKGAMREYKRKWMAEVREVMSEEEKAEERSKARERMKIQRENMSKEARDKARGKARDGMKEMRKGFDDVDKFIANEKANKGMATEKNKAAGLKRKQEKGLVKAEAKEAERWPQKPEVTRFRVRETYYRGFLIRDSARPTCPEGVELDIGMAVTCYPAPTFTWFNLNFKDGKQIGTKTCGDEAKNRKLRIELKEQETCSSSSQEKRRKVAGVEEEVMADSWKDKEKMICSNWFFKSWRAGRTVMDEGTETLARKAFSHIRIWNTKVEDAGEYKVVAANEHGEVERTLTVDFTPTLVRDINHKELSVEPGDRACLAVEMSGGRVKWFKDTEVKDDPGFRVETVTELYKEFKEYEYEGEVKDATSYLRIRDCKPEDSGIYTGR